MIHIAVVDDEPIFRATISSIVKDKMADLEIPCSIHVFSSSEELIRHLDSFPLSLIFLDIDMPKTSGLEAGKYLLGKSQNRQVVFVSGHDCYIFDAVKVYPFDFIRKNRMKKEIPETIEKFIGIYEVDNKFISVMSGYKPLRVLLKDILYISKINRRTCIFRIDGEPVYTWEPLSSLEKECQGLGFVKIHKDTIINLKHVDAMESGKIILADGTLLTSSKDRYESIIQQFLVYRRK